MSDQPAAPAPQAAKTNTMAILALVFSAVGFVTLFWGFGFLLAILGAIFGHVGMSQIAKSNESGRGLALAGVIVGWASVGIAVLGIIAIVAFFGGLAGLATLGL